jgi:hypothetical protein
MVSGTHPAAKGKMVFCILVIDLPIIMARLAFGLCLGPGFPHVVLVWLLSISLPWVWREFQFSQRL